MFVKIWTHWRGETWEGEVPGVFQDGSLDLIFRMFNRVEPEDNDRLESWGYRLPSLSVGDRVTVGGRRFAVAVVGWREEPADSPLPEPGPNVDRAEYAGR